MSRYIDIDTLKIPSEEMVAKMIINSAPTIEPKRGEWKVKQSGFAECSVCEQCYFSDYNFCPNCGADMREREGE